jgi:signal transduction histidine kinase
VNPTAGPGAGAFAAWRRIERGRRLIEVVVVASVAVVGASLASHAELGWWTLAVAAAVLAAGAGLVAVQGRLAHDAEAVFRREAEAAEHLGAVNDLKDSLLGVVSHELRTPLTNIVGYARTMEDLDMRLSPEQRREFVHRIVAGARKLDVLLNDLLDVDRLARGIIEPQRCSVDVGELVRRVVADSDCTASRTVHVDTDRAVCSVDPGKVERIVDNLLSNAGWHSPASSPVWVSVHAGDGGVCIAVEDSGPGVPISEREAIFAPFHRGNGARRDRGVGIGLSLVARFAELHGGRAWVTDRDGGGASFQVWLPDAQPAAAVREGKARVGRVHA